jgi:hypothetical protein
LRQHVFKDANGPTCSRERHPASTS